MCFYGLWGCTTISLISCVALIVSSFPIRTDLRLALFIFFGLHKIFLVSLSLTISCLWIFTFPLCVRVCVCVTVMACIVRGIMEGERHDRLAGEDNARKVCESCQEFVMQLERTTCDQKWMTTSETTALGNLSGKRIFLFANLVSNRGNQKIKFSNLVVGSSFAK